MLKEDVQPKPGANSFKCPHCHIHAKQQWFKVIGLQVRSGKDRTDKSDSGFSYSQCDNCDGRSIWKGESRIHPVESFADPPHADLPDDVKRDYLEASGIASLSPRGAAALLRLALQKLCRELGQPGRHLNQDIRNLVDSGLPVEVQQALHIVRVVGNESVHPGTMDIRDDKNTVYRLFNILNFIAEKMISEPKKIKMFYGELPDKKRPQ